MPGRLRILAPGTQCRKTRLGASPVPSRNCSRADGDGGARLPLLPCTHTHILANTFAFIGRTLFSRLLAPAAAIRRSIIRHLVLLLDLSASMADRDMRPTRFDLTLEYAREFITEWFDQNPLGQIGIVGMRGGIGERIGEMSGAFFSLLIVCSFFLLWEIPTLSPPSSYLISLLFLFFFLFVTPSLHLAAVTTSLFYVQGTHRTCSVRYPNGISSSPSANQVSKTQSRWHAAA